MCLAKCCSSLSNVHLISEKSAKVVLFTAMTINNAKTTEDKPVIFDNVLANEGGCFEKTTGVFTVKVAGSYVFTATAGSVSSDKLVTAYITVGGKHHTYLRGSSQSVGSCSVAVKLAVGKKVWMEAYRPPENYCSKEVSFSGTLIQPLL